MPTEQFARLEPGYTGARVCVTGGCGFIGSHLVDALLSLGASITIIDDLSNADDEHVAGLVDLEPDRVRLVRASILDDRGLAEAVAGVRTIFHLAAIGSVPLSIRDPQRAFAVNATGTLRVLEAARQAGAGRVVLSSSSSVYGGEGSLPSAEDQPGSTKSPYAASKLAAEHLAQAWTASMGVGAVSLRYFNVFGPRQREDSPYAAVIPRFVRALLAGQAPTIFGDGSQTRDFTPVGSAVLANLLAGVAGDEAEGRTYNVGTGVRTSVGDLASMIARRLDATHLGVTHEPERAGDVLHSQADIARIRAELGYEPIGTLETELGETIAWFQDRYERTEAR